MRVGCQTFRDFPRFGVRLQGNPDCLCTVITITLRQNFARVKNIPRAHPIRPADLAQVSSEYQALAEDLSEVTRELRDHLELLSRALNPPQKVN
jgi:hypothetical protein